MIEYLYDNKLEILKTNSKGILRIDDIVSHYYTIAKNNILTENLKILIDCRETKFDVEPDEIILINDAVKKALNKYAYIKEAILIEQPYETVLATIFEKGIKLDHYNFKIFSTENAALSWLVEF